MIKIERFECQKCGECCKSMAVPIYLSDFERWEKERRWDIIKEVSFVVSDKGAGFVFVETVPKTGVCPFLSSGNICLIYDIRPKVCRNFPLASAEQEDLAKCVGIGKGRKIDPRIIESNSADELNDFLEAWMQRRRIMALLEGSRMLYVGISEGLLVYDTHKGKYKFTRKGKEFHRRRRNRRVPDSLEKERSKD